MDTERDALEPKAVVAAWRAFYGCGGKPDKDEAEQMGAAVRAYLAALSTPPALIAGGPPVEGSIPSWAKWCQPGDMQDKRYFIVKFEDRDRADALFTDEAEAREFYARATVSWNCWLFGALPAFPASGEANG